MQCFDENTNVYIEHLDVVAKEMKAGKVAIFPTETVYGIGTNAFNEKACEKIYEVKKRPKNKPLIVLISNIDMLYEIIQTTNEVENKLIERFWPGPLTIVFEKKGNTKLSKIVTAEKNTVGVRMTDGKIAKILVEKAGVPIVAPSANLSGKPSGTKISDIIEDFSDNVDYILDCGDIQDKTTSTLVKVENDIIHILRQGKITKDELEKVAKVTL